MALQGDVWVAASNICDLLKQIQVIAISSFGRCMDIENRGLVLVNELVKDEARTAILGNSPYF